MGDSTSNEIFATFFDLLASDPTPQHVEWAHKLWKKTKDYDFCDNELGCEKSLAKLGLARKRVDPEYPEDGKMWFYGLEGKDGR